MPYSYASLTAALADAGIAEASDEAALLLGHFARAGRASLLCDRRRVYDAPGLDAAVAERLSRRPLQYILGSWDFGGCTFTVNEHCLIPRPDTEVLVDEAAARIPAGAVCADLCTGSGCIAVSLLHRRPDLVCAALELYPDTLALAVRNARDNGVASRFIPVEADLLSGGPAKLADAVRACPDTRASAPFGGFAAILSNPPYIRTDVVRTLEPELAHEPAAALDGGQDGLTFYRAILSDYRSLLLEGGLLFLEIGFDQADDIAALAGEAGGWTAPEIVKDLGGRDRVAILRKI